MGSPAIALELLGKVQVELMRIGRWSEGLEMPTTKLLLPVTGLLLSRLEDLIAQKGTPPSIPYQPAKTKSALDVAGFTDAAFLWTIPPQVELVLGQVTAAVTADLAAQYEPPPEPLPVDWARVGAILKAGKPNPLKDATVVGKPTESPRSHHPRVRRSPVQLLQWV